MIYYYKGQLIEKATPSGLYSSRVNLPFNQGGQSVRADTLTGIKRLICELLEGGSMVD